MASDKIQRINEFLTLNHQTQTLVCENALSAVQERDDIPPLRIHTGFSGFYLVLIDKSGSETKILRVFLKAGKEIPEIFDNYSVALGLRSAFIAEQMKARAAASNSPAESGKSPAYTVQITTGTYKGKTPAQILIEKPDELTGLLRTKDWLVSNLAKYPNNQKIIDAIVDAANLLDIGELVPETNAVVPAEPDVRYPEFVIFEAGEKTISARTKDNKKIKCEVKLTYEHSRRNPWVLTIKNQDFYEDGEKKQYAGTSRYASYAMNQQEMSELMRAMKTQLDLFETMAFPSEWNWRESHKWSPDQGEPEPE